MKLLVLLALAVAAVQASQTFLPFLKHGLPPPTPRLDRDISPTLLFDQMQDHFDPTNSNTFQQRYWYNDEFCAQTDKSGCPVFLLIQGESQASTGWLTSGQWYLMAQEQGAFMLTIEHRYYGESSPTSDWSDQSFIRFLSSRQAEADVANFIQQMNAQMGFQGPWITFGGSYAGALSAWARTKYPDLVWGAVSSSGPLEAKLDFWEYYETCYDSLGTTENGADCQAQYTQAFETAEDMLKSQDTATELFTLMNTCDIIDINNQLDLWSFGRYFNSIIGGTVQYNGFYPYTIDNICQTMTDPLGGTALDRYAQVAFQLNGAECSYVGYDYIVNALNNETPADPRLARQWGFQTCSEFGWYQTSNIPAGYQGDENMHPVEWEEQICLDVYGDRFAQENLQGFMDSTNAYYGGKTPEGVTRVVYVNGSIDPWHRPGIWESDLNPDAPHIYIQGASHCADMYEPDRITSPELEEARAQIRDLVATWINEYNTIEK